MTILKVLNTNYITHNVKRFVLEKPKDFLYRPGQSGHFSLNIPNWEHEIRPFSFTSLNDWPYLELIIKIYKEHNGVTAQLEKINAGASFILHDVFGTISYKGPGVFIAGGTGITPFIAIFRALFYSGNLRNIGLLYSNKSEDDIILHDELQKMLGVAYMNVFTKQGVIGFKERRIDKNFLIETIGDFNRHFYVCGPKLFTEEISTELLSLGVQPNALVV